MKQLMRVFCVITAVLCGCANQGKLSVATDRQSVPADLPFEPFEPSAVPFVEAVEEDQQRTPFEVEGDTPVANLPELEQPFTPVIPPVADFDSAIPTETVEEEQPPVEEPLPNEDLPPAPPPRAPYVSTSLIAAGTIRNDLANSGFITTSVPDSVPDFWLRIFEQFAIPFPGYNRRLSVTGAHCHGQRLFFVTAEEAAPGHVNVFNFAGVRVASFLSLPAGTVGARIAAGDITGDGCDELIVGSGVGGRSLVRVFTHRGEFLTDFRAYLGPGNSLHTAYNGPVNVAAGDIDGDGEDEIITGTDVGVPHFKVFQASPSGVSEIRSEHAFVSANGAAVPVGIDVAAGDVNGDGREDVVISARGQGAPSHVIVRSGADLNHSLLSFISEASPALVLFGARVATGDFNQDGAVDIAVQIGQTRDVNIHLGTNGVRFKRVRFVNHSFLTIGSI